MLHSSASGRRGRWPRSLDEATTHPRRVAPDWAAHIQGVALTDAWLAYGAVYGRSAEGMTGQLHVLVFDGACERPDYLWLRHYRECH